jgi:hypothetical protein
VDVVTAATFAQPAHVEPTRDRWGRPLIRPLDGGKPVAYTRVSTMAKALDDGTGLTDWKCGQTAVGVGLRRDLADMAVACRDDKQKLREVVKGALSAAESDAAANKGTVLHSWTEKLDAGMVTLEQVPDHLRDDLTAYVNTMSSMRTVMRERFVVVDEVQVAGSFDRMLLDTAALMLVMGDIKTGQTAEKYPHAIAAQLAMYAHGQLYDVDTGQRTPLPAALNLATGLLIHLPVGSGECRLHALDIAAGWESVLLSKAVREWRKRRIIAPWVVTS